MPYPYRQFQHEFLEVAVKESVEVIQRNFCYIFWKTPRRISKELSGIFFGKKILGFSFYGIISKWTVEKFQGDFFHLFFQEIVGKLSASLSGEISGIILVQLSVWIIMKWMNFWSSGCI